SAASRTTEAAMSRRKKDPLRDLTADERRGLTRISRPPAPPALGGPPGKNLLAVAPGHAYQAPPPPGGPPPPAPAAPLRPPVNAGGTAAVPPRHGGGRRPTYGPEARGRIAAEAARAPTPERDGTATWSLTTLRRALRAAPDGLPRVSTYTIRGALHEAGTGYQ